MAKKIKKYQQNTSTGRTLLKIFGWVLLVAIISFGAFSGLKIYRENNTQVESNTQDINTAEIDDDPIKTAEPDNESKTTHGNDAKAKTDELEKQQAKETPTNEDGLKQATVVINEPYEENGNIIISSMITNIVETEGDCVYIFTNDSRSITKKTRVLPNAKNTICEAVVLEKKSLAAGKWKVRLEYKSNYSEGRSETQTFTVK